MAKPSDRFANFYTNGTLELGTEVLVVDRNRFGNRFQEVVLSLRAYDGTRLMGSTISDSAFIARTSDIRRFRIGAKCTDTSRLRGQDQILLASNASKNMHIGSIDTARAPSRAYYSSDITLYWLDSDFNARSYTPYLLEEVYDNPITLDINYDITKNKGTNKNMSNVKSPNGTRTVNGSTISALPDHQLIPMLVNPTWSTSSHCRN